MKLTKTLSTVALVATIALGASSCSSVKAHGGDLQGILESQTLVVGTNAEYSPFEYISSKTGKVVGYDIDLVNLFESFIETKYNIDLKVIIKDMAFDGLIGSMNAGQIDFIAAAFSKDAEREETLLFSDIYYQAQTVLVVKEDEKSITDYNSLNGIKLGAQLGTVQVDFAAEATGENNVKALGSLSTLILDLTVGNVTALVVEKPVAENIISKNSGYKIIDTISFADDDGYGFATNKGNEALVAELNEFISINQTNGKFAELFVKAQEEALNN
jgi:polar amino acid transport system substrate-binding protein